MNEVSANAVSSARVGDQTMRDFSRLLNSSFGSVLNGDQDPKPWQLTTVTRLEHVVGEECFLLSLVSYGFRMGVGVHFTYSDELEKYFVGALKSSLNNLEKQSVYDQLGEIGNEFCGKLKRDLVQALPHLGMSTPNLVSRECVEGLSDLGFHQSAHLTATFGSNLELGCSLFVDTYQDLNIRLANAEVSDEGMGTLELF